MVRPWAVAAVEEPGASVWGDSVRAGRIMQRRVGNVEPRMFGGENSLEAGDIRARWRIGHADNLDLMRAQQRQEVEIAGIVDQHRIVWTK